MMWILNHIQYTSYACMFERFMFCVINIVVKFFEQNSFPGYLLSVEILQYEN